eukprot:1254700-Prymnesium_polylepis.1
MSREITKTDAERLAEAPLGETHSGVPFSDHSSSKLSSTSDMLVDESGNVFDAAAATILDESEGVEEGDGAAEEEGAESEGVKEGDGAAEEGGAEINSAGSFDIEGSDMAGDEVPDEVPEEVLVLTFPVARWDACDRKPRRQVV